MSDRSRRRRRRGREPRVPYRPREVLLAYCMLLPSLVVFGVFVFYPFVKDLQLPFFTSPPKFGAISRAQRYVGWSQWRAVLTSSEFRNTLTVTVKFTVLTVPLGVALGLLLAVAAHQQLRGITVFRTIFSSTVATSIAVASVMFFSLTNPVVGFWQLHVGHGGITESPTWALPAICAVTVWQSLGLSFIVMSAGLQSIPDEIVEAARVDGAGTWGVLRNVTLPLLTPTLFFAFVVGSISSFQAFAQVDLLTQGGPLNRTQTLAYSIYKTSIQAGGPSDENKAAVFAIGLFVVILVLTVLQLRLERRVNYAR